MLRVAPLLLALIAAALAWAVLFRAALQGIPVEAGDSAFFSPVVHQMSTRGALIQPYVLHVSGHLFHWHGWLFPQVMAAFPWTGTYSGIGAAYLLLAAIVTGLFGCLVVRRFGMLTAAPAIIAIFALTLFQLGRMELLTSLFVCLALPLLFPGPTRPWHHGALIVLLALIGVTQPTFAFLCGIALTAGFALWARNLRHFVILCIAYGAGSAALAALATELHPQISFAQWLLGLTAQSELIASRPGGSLTAAYLTDPNHFLKIGYWLALLVLACGLWKGMAERDRSAVLKGLLALIMVTLALALWFLAGRLPEAAYNLLALGPLILFGLASLSRHRWRGRSAALAVLLLIACGGGVSIAYRAVTASITAERALTLQAMSEALRPLVTQARDIGGNHTVAPYLAETFPHKQLRVWPRSDNFPQPPGAERLPSRRPPELLVFLQAHSGLAQPPDTGGYRLLLDRFDRTPPQIFGQAIGRTHKGFSFAAYCRVDVCARFGDARPRP